MAANEIAADDSTAPEARKFADLDMLVLGWGDVEEWAITGAWDVNPGAVPGEREAQTELLRDIFGNPFHAVTLAPACRTPPVLALAQAAYDERSLPSGELAAERLAVLADALEDAGATGDILAHLRGPGSHVRGCWALDLALGKE